MSAPYAPVRKIEMTTIGQNSPATPDPSTAEPSLVGSRPASASTGTSVPSAVVLIATPSSQPSASRLPTCSRRPTTTAIASEIAQPIAPRTSDRGATWCSTSSTPAKKNRKTRPRSARKSMWSSTCARSSPSGPIRIPSRISRTTVGRTRRRLSLDRIAPALAAASTRTREPTSAVVSTASGTSAVTKPVAGVSPQLPANDSPGSSRISASPVRNAFGGQVIGSTARRAGSRPGAGRR